MRRGSTAVLILFGALAAFIGGCVRTAPIQQVAVHLQVTNRTAESVTVRWRDNKISGESGLISPGQSVDVRAQFTLQGAGDLRVTVLGLDGRVIRSKRFDAQELRAAKFSRKLIVSPPLST